MAKLFIEDLKNLQGKKVVMRVDFNVPLDGDKVTDTSRIDAALPSINHLVKAGARIILMSHLGRPKGKVKEKYSLKPVVGVLSERIGKPVAMATDCVGPEVAVAASALKDGEVLLLENLRFHPEEEANDPNFAKELASLGDVYVNDAFGTAHRAHASTAGITEHLEQNACGYLIKKELDFLGKLLDNPPKPFAAILGGAKISGKIDVITNLMDKVDILIIGGGMVYTFLKANDVEIGRSLLECDRLHFAKHLLEELGKRPLKFHLPVDHKAATAYAADADVEIVGEKEIPADRECLDIGPESVKLFAETLSQAKTIFWNGPMGVFEMERFAEGTNEMARIVAELTDRGATSVVGGGDSVAAVKKAGLGDRISHISTGGGASLEFLEGKELPGIAALTDV